MSFVKEPRGKHNFKTRFHVFIQFQSNTIVSMVTMGVSTEYQFAHSIFFFKELHFKFVLKSTGEYFGEIDSISSHSFDPNKTM